MSLETMETLAATEERLRQRRAEAQAAAKQAAADARETGESLIAKAVERAGAEIGELARQTEEKAQTAAQNLAAGSEASRGNLRAQAKQREEEAVSFVVERIVNG